MDAIVTWFDQNKRDLPWREPTCSPWGILVSEVMLQQTPVKRVLPVWEEWMRRWPTPADCASAPLSEALTLWGKLGYPRRAKRLHEAARALVLEHSGAVPQDLQALLDLPGIGDYTARAIRCFAFGFPEPVVDTNVRRVLQRLINGEGEAGPPRTRPDLASAQGALDALGSTRDKVILAQGLMELGAVVCKARVPLCQACPVPDHCPWRARGYPPYTGPKAPTQATFEGSDRQARGIILRELRASDTPVPGHFLQNLIAEPDQFIRAKDSLISDGLVIESIDQPGGLHLAN